MAQRVWNWVKSHPYLSSAAAAGGLYAAYTYIDAQNKKKAAIEAERVRRNREESERRDKARREQQANNSPTGTLAGSPKTPKVETPEVQARNAALEREGEAIVEELTHAPEFSIEAYWEGEYSTVALGDFKGKWVVLLFTPADHALTGSEQLISLNDNLPRFKQFATDVVVISPDSKAALQKAVEQPRAEGGLGGVDFVLISDMNDTVSHKYGLQASLGQVSVVIVDPQGHVAERQSFPTSANHVAHDILATVGRLQAQNE